MPLERSLLRERITLSEAKNRETNVLHQLTYVAQAASFRNHIEKQRSYIEAVVAHHLGLAKRHRVHVADRSEWFNGSFNLCVPVHVQSPNPARNQQLLIRFPLPYKTGEAFRPGNSDEKIRCEAATYAWLNQECPNIPTAGLHGFGLSTGQRFTLLRNAPLLIRWYEYLKRRVLPWFGLPLPCQYIPHPTSASDALGVGYLLLDYVKDGRMLSETYFVQNDDAARRANLFRDLARIQLTLSQKPLPRIGSLTVDDAGVLSLRNRPLTLEICHMENERILIDIPQDTTYSSVNAYVHDLLYLHDTRLRHQPNGASDLDDCLSQMSALSTMRAMYPEFMDRNLQHGPFVLTLTDMHLSNIFVDEEWHITALLDLEWACVWPIEMHHTPYWLTSRWADRIDEEEYASMCNEFISIVAEEESRLWTQPLDKKVIELPYSERLRRLWERGTFWYWYALDSPSALHHIFYDRLLPLYQKPQNEEKYDSSFYLVAPAFWCTKAWDFMKEKEADKEEYDKDLEHAFQQPP